MTKPYWPELDGLRAVAFLLVFVYHAAPNRHANVGWIGVDIFFALSAFLIVSRLRAGGEVSLAEFYKRRAARIWPLYFLYVTVSLALVDAYDRFDHAIPLLTFTSNFSYVLRGSSMPPFLEHLWSIALEEQFYLVAPLIVLAVPRLRARPAAFTCATICAFAVVFRVWLASIGADPRFAYALLPGRIEALAAGTLLGLVGSRAPLWAARAIGAGALLVLTALAQWPPWWLATELVWWQLSASGFVAVGLLVWAIGDPALGRVLSFAPLRWLGRLSFGLYVFHPAALMLTRSQFAGWFVAIVGLGLTILAATLSYYGWERRWLQSASAKPNPMPAATITPPANATAGCAIQDGEAVASATS